MILIFLLWLLTTVFNADWMWDKHMFWGELSRPTGFNMENVTAPDQPVLRRWRTGSSRLRSLADSSRLKCAGAGCYFPLTADLYFSVSSLYLSLFLSLSFFPPKMWHNKLSINGRTNINCAKTDDVCIVTLGYLYTEVIVGAILIRNEGYRRKILDFNHK